METTLYYFSGTGNSLAMAKALAEKISNCRLEPMVRCLQNGQLKAETEKVGFVFPLYFLGLPLIVEEFISRIDLSKAEYIFFVETRGGNWSPEYVTERIEKLLKEKGKTLSGGFKIVMPNNYIKKGYTLDPQQEVKEKFEKAKIKITRVSECIIAGRKSIERDTFGTVWLSKWMNQDWQKKVHGRDQDFFVEDSCISCGICKDVCPVDNIIIREGRPQWQHHCQECLACYHFCPKASIRCDGKSKRKGQYHHPDISIKEIEAQK
ncbi:MAG: EFR1 family ferrodoxin [Clostridia bacterium]|nr:EFR1 family ferrodoxin [Clostridia bacterium]